MADLPLSMDRLREMLWRAKQALRAGATVYPVPVDDWLLLIESAMRRCTDPFEDPFEGAEDENRDA
jgi:hypothetical protein